MIPFHFPPITAKAASTGHPKLQSGLSLFMDYASSCINRCISIRMYFIPSPQPSPGGRGGYDANTYATINIISYTL